MMSYNVSLVEKKAVLTFFQRKIAFVESNSVLISPFRGCLRLLHLYMSSIYQEIGEDV